MKLQQPYLEFSVTIILSKVSKNLEKIKELVHIHGKKKERKKDCERGGIKNCRDS